MTNFKDYEFGCRSALRIAIRRGDIGLAFSAFKMIWSNIEHRNWFKFRLPLIVVEEAFYLIGVYASFLERINNLGEETSYGNFICILTLCKKSKDVGALAKLCVAKHGATEWKHRELVSCRKLWSIVCESGIEEISYHMLNHEANHNELSNEYQKKALAVLYECIREGGNQWNRKTLLLGMLLIILRGLDEQLISLEVKRAYNKVPKKIKSVKFPWYAFTPCSHVANAALLPILKNNNITRDMIEKVWFYSEAEYTNPDILMEKKLSSRKNSCFESMWWGYERRKHKTYDKRWKVLKSKVKRQVEKILGRVKPCKGIRLSGQYIR